MREFRGANVRACQFIRPAILVDDLESALAENAEEVLIETIAAVCFLGFFGGKGRRILCLPNRCLGARKRASLGYFRFARCVFREVFIAPVVSLIARNCVERHDTDVLIMTCNFSTTLFAGLCLGRLLHALWLVYIGERLDELFDEVCEHLLLLFLSFFLC